MAFCIIIPGNSPLSPGVERYQSNAGDRPMKAGKKERPESLATFAEASRSGGKKPDDLGLVADPHTAPIPTDSKKKDEAATKVLQEGVTGKDRGSEEAIDKLPDRIIESRD
jgi:hypothetical protein